LSPGQVISPIRNRLSPEIISDIMMYKDHLARKGKVLSLWKGAGLGMGDELEMESIGVPEEWKDRWWKEREERWS